MFDVTDRTNANKYIQPQVKKKKPISPSKNATCVIRDVRRQNDGESLKLSFIFIPHEVTDWRDNPWSEKYITIKLSFKVLILMNKLYNGNDKI